MTVLPSALRFCTDEQTSSETEAGIAANCSGNLEGATDEHGSRNSRDEESTHLI